MVHDGGQQWTRLRDSREGLGAAVVMKCAGGGKISGESWRRGWGRGEGQWVGVVGARRGQE